MRNLRYLDQSKGSADTHQVQSSMHALGYWPELPDIAEELPGWETCAEIVQPDFSRCIEFNPGTAVAQLGGVEACTDASVVSVDETTEAEPSETVTRDKCARKTRQNRQAQQRFRQRHKVGTLISSTLSDTPMPGERTRVRKQLMLCRLA